MNMLTNLLRRDIYNVSSKRSLVSFKDIFGGKGDKKKSEQIKEEAEALESDRQLFATKSELIKKDEASTKASPSTQLTRLVRFKEYNPPNDVAARLKQICSEELGKKLNESEFAQFTLSDSLTKFKVLHLTFLFI